jgi:hypothetical protein
MRDLLSKHFHFTIVHPTSMNNKEITNVSFSIVEDEEFNSGTLMHTVVVSFEGIPDGDYTLNITSISDAVNVRVVPISGKNVEVYNVE